MRNRVHVPGSRPDLRVPFTDVTLSDHRRHAVRRLATGTALRHGRSRNRPGRRPATAAGDLDLRTG